MLDKVFDHSGHDDTNNSGYTEIHNSSQKHHSCDTRDSTSLTEMKILPQWHEDMRHAYPSKY